MCHVESILAERDLGMSLLPGNAFLLRERGENICELEALGLRLRLAASPARHLRSHVL